MEIREALIQVLVTRADWHELGDLVGLTGDDAMRNVADYIIRYANPERAATDDAYLLDCIDDWLDWMRG